MGYKFTCAICRGEFESERSEADAMEELERDFPGTSEQDCNKVCETCYREYMKYRQKNTMHHIPAQQAYLSEIAIPPDQVEEIKKDFADLYRNGKIPKPRELDALLKKHNLKKSRIPMKLSWEGPKSP